MDNDHVAVRPEYTQYWTLVRPARSSTWAQQGSELVEVCAALYDAFDMFVVPCEISYTTNQYPEEWSLREIWEDIDGRFDSEEVRLSDSDGVSLDRLSTAIEQDSSEGRYISSVIFDHNRVRVSLDSVNMFVDRSEGVVEYRGSSPLEDEPSTDPLSFQVTHAPNRCDDDIDSEFVFEVKVRTTSRIWFREDEVNRANRRRLRNMLEKLESSLDVQKVIRDTDYDSLDSLKSLF